MSQGTLPPPYISSIKVLNGVSAAVSVFNNSRGLEFMWNGPYGQTLHELVDSYAEGPFLVYSPYKLWLPGLVKAEQLLRSEFSDLGIDYDIIPSERVCQMRVRASIKRRNDLQSSRLNGHGFTQRTREIEEKKLAEMISDKKIETIVEDLKKRRLLMIKKQEEFEERMNTPPSFDDSLESSPDTASFEHEPDIVVTHVANVLLPPDPIYEHRAFRKPYYERAAILAELKSGVSRTLKDKRLIYEAFHFQINRAITDMIDYCSSYFACYPDAKSVIALVAGGQMWRWANIKRSETPKWDFLMNTANRTSPKNLELLSKWEMLFETDKAPFQLGTARSDEELTTINQKYLYPLLAQTPPVPDSLLPQRGEESQNEYDGAQEEEEDDSVLDEDEEAEEEQEDHEIDRGRWSEDDD